MPSPMPNPFVVVVTRRPLTEGDPVAKVLAPLHATVVGVWQDDPQFAELAAKADAFVFSGGFSKKMFDAAPKCQIVARDGIGYDTVDVAAATARKIWVTIIPDALIDDVADHAMMLLMAANRRLAFLDDATRADKWRAAGADYYQNPPRKLKDATLGLVGLGRIGRGVAERARGFGMNVIASDPVISPELAKSVGAELVPLDDLLNRSDFVSLHVPLGAGTQHLIGERELRLMKPTAILVNTARGSVVDEPALTRALSEGWIRGAGLDVFEKEPTPADNPLLKMRNVVVTPHVASVSDVSNVERRAEAAGEVLRVLSGEKPRPQAVVNRELFK